MYIIGKGVIGGELITSFKKKDIIKDIIFDTWETGVLWSLDYGNNVINSAWERTPIEKQQKIKANTKYIYSIASGTSAYTTIGFYDKDGNYISRTINNNFTTPDNAYYVRISAKTTDTSLKILIKPDNNVENLIKDIYNNSPVANATKTYDSVNKIWTLTPSNSSDAGIVIDTLNNKIKLNETYTVGYKLKIDSSSSTTGVCNKRIMVCEYRTFSIKYGVSESVTSDGNDWIDIRIKIYNTKLDGGVRILFGTNSYKGGSYYIKEPFLIQGDYTNKKLPDSLFK